MKLPKPWLRGLQLASIAVALYVALVVYSRAVRPVTVPWPVVNGLTRVGLVHYASQDHSLYVWCRTRFMVDLQTTEPQIDAIWDAVKAAPNRVGFGTE